MCEEAQHGAIQLSEGELASRTCLLFQPEVELNWVLRHNHVLVVGLILSAVAVSLGSCHTLTAMAKLLEAGSLLFALPDYTWAGCVTPAV